MTRSTRTCGWAPSSTPDHLAKIEGFVAEAREAGAEVKVGGTRLEHESGQFMAPTIVDGVKPQMTIAREEVFGPVLSILTFDTAEEAIAIANGTDYGLSAGVWSRDFDTCLNVGRGIHAGTVWMNTFMDGAQRTSLRWVQAVRPRPRIGPQGGRRLHRREDPALPLGPAHGLVGATTF